MNKKELREEELAMIGKQIKMIKEAFASVIENDFCDCRMVSVIAALEGLYVLSLIQFGVKLPKAVKSFRNCYKRVSAEEVRCEGCGGVMVKEEEIKENKDE